MIFSRKLQFTRPTRAPRLTRVFVFLFFIRAFFFFLFCPGGEA